MLRIRARVSDVVGDQAVLQLATGGVIKLPTKHGQFKLGTDWNIYLDEVVSDAVVRDRIASWNRRRKTNG